MRIHDWPVDIVDFVVTPSTLTIAEGDSATLEGSFGDPGVANHHVVRVNWGDGTVDELTLAIGENDFSVDHVYPDDDPTATGEDTYTVSVTLNHPSAPSQTKSFALKVLNVAPTDLTGVFDAPAIAENGVAVLRGSFIDPGTRDSHTVSVSWGDGTTSQAAVDGTTYSATHRYLDDNPTGTEADQYAVTVTVVDDDGGVATTTTSVLVEDVAPSITSLVWSEPVVEEGSATKLTGTFSDPGTRDTFTVEIDWDDGNVDTFELPAGSTMFDATHAYRDDNPSGTPHDTRDVTVTVTDDDGKSGGGTAELTVNNAAPSQVSLGTGELEVDEGMTITLEGSFADPGVDDTHTVVVDWGDGTSDDFIVDQGERTFAIEHVYLDDHPATGTPSDELMVAVYVTDDDAGVSGPGLAETLVIDEVTGEVLETLVGEPVITVHDVAPVVASDLPTQDTVQYSDPIETVIVSASDVAGDSMVASTTWAFDGGTSQAGLPGAVSLEPVACLVTVAENTNECSWRLSGIADMAPGTYDIDVAVTDDDTLATTTTVTIVVQAEDALAFYSGPTFAATASSASDEATIELRATVLDISSADAGSPGWDADPGDTLNSTVTFIDRLTGEVLCSDLAPQLVFAGDHSLAVASCDWTVNIGSSDAEQYQVAVVVGGHYSRNNQDDDVLVTIAKPLDNFITGGGYLELANSAGVQAGSEGLKANFGFNVKFNKKGTNLQGKATVIFRSGSQTFKIRTSAIHSLGVHDPGDWPRAAEFESKANLTDITDEENPLGLGGGLTFQMRMTDIGQAEGVDTISFTLWDKDGLLLFSSSWNGVEAIEQQLGGGNLTVHGNGGGPQ